MGDALHPQTYLAYGMNAGVVGGQRRSVADAGAAAAWLQEREVCYSPDGDGRSEEVR